MWLKTLLRVALVGGVVVLLNACSDAASEAEAVDNKVPQTVAAQPKDTEVVVTWDPVPYAERYVVCWAYVPITDCDPANPKIVRIDPNPAITETEWAHTGITNSTKYHYAVIAVLAEGESAISANVSGIPEGITPPTVVSISTYDLTATIGWEPVVGASGYRLHMATQEGVKVGNPNSLQGYMWHDVPEGALEYVHSGLTEGQDYYFIVTALKDVGGGEILESVESQEVIAIPKALDVYEEGFVPNDFTVTVGTTGLDTSNAKVEFFDLILSDPCTETRNQNFSMHWSDMLISIIPPSCAEPGTNRFCDITPSSPQRVLSTDGVQIIEGTLYYFTAANLSSACGTRQVPIGSVMTGNVAARTPGVITPTIPVISAVVPQDIANAVTITIEQYDPNLKYNLYMVSNQFFQAGNTTLTVENHELDVNWGMKHSDIPEVFVHKALPSSLEFSFIVTSVNSIGVESAASEMVTATP